MFRVEQVERDWLDKTIETMSLVVFGEPRAASFDRSQFALISYRDDEPTGFVSCIEMDAKTVYWQFGGAFPNAASSMLVVPSYLAMIDKALESYRQIWTRIENSNIRMLHLAMKMGFRIVGTWNFEDKIYLELVNKGDR